MATDPDKLLVKLKKADREVEQAKAGYDEATAKRADLMVDAAEAGMSRAAIAGAVGKSITRVQQIIERRRDKQAG